MSRASNDREHLVGGVPRANLLPPSIYVAEKTAAARKGAVTVIVATLVIAVAGAGAAFWYAGDRQSALAAEQRTTDDLLAQQLQYTEVRLLEQQITTAEAARVLAVSPEIDWREYLGYIQASLPEGTTVTSFDLTSGSVTTPFAPPSDPLQGPRVAQLSFVAVSPELPDVSQWIDNLAEVPGFQDATPSSLRNDESGWTATIVMHVNAQALSGRFADAEEADE